MFVLLVGDFNVLGGGHTVHKVDGVGVKGVSGEAFDEAKGVVAFFSGILKGAGDPGGLPGFLVFLGEFGYGCPAGHAHVFGEVL